MTVLLDKTAIVNFPMATTVVEIYLQEVDGAVVKH